MSKGGEGEYRQLTVRFPAAVWAELSRTVKDQGGGSLNEFVVQTVTAELARRRRARLLEQIAKRREEIARRWGAAEDSTPYIRALREGRRRDD